MALRHQCVSPPQRAASQSRVRRLWQRPDTAFTAIRRKETPWGRKDFGAAHADDRWQVCRRRLRAECFEIGERPSRQIRNDLEQLLCGQKSPIRSRPGAAQRPGDGLPVQLMSKVPNWRFPTRYPIDFVRRTFWGDSDKLTAENSNEINIRFLKTGLSARIVRGGRGWCPNGLRPRTDLFRVGLVVVYTVGI